MRRRQSGMWKSGNPAFGFPLLHRPQFFFVFLVVIAYEQQQTIGFFPELRRGRGIRADSSHMARLLASGYAYPGSLPATPARLAERGRPAELQNAVRPPSSSAPAWSTSSEIPRSPVEMALWLR